ncbi:MAG: CDP-glucose 4,6-dehydratase [Planctomycetota bacterium]
MSDRIAWLKRQFQGRRVLLTGHTGFKGGWLAIWLKDLGAEVAGLALDPSTQPSLFDAAEVRGCLVEDFRVDIRDGQRVRDTVCGFNPEIALHLAAQPIVRTAYKLPAETFHTNVGGTVNVLEALRHCDAVKSIVVVTTDKVYENREWVHAYREPDPLGGHDPYSASKAACEIAAASYARAFFHVRKVGFATCRAGNVIGGGDWADDRIVADSVRALAQGKPIPVRNPASTRPWQHVLEPLHGYLLTAARLLEAPEDISGAWNFAPEVDSGRPVEALVKLFLDEWGGGGWEDLSQQQGNAPHEAQRLALAWDKAYRVLGWQPIWNFETTIRRTVAWYRDQLAGKSALTLCRNDLARFQQDLQEHSQP